VNAPVRCGDCGVEFIPRDGVWTHPGECEADDLARERYNAGHTSFELGYD